MNYVKSSLKQPISFLVSYLLILLVSYCILQSKTWVVNHYLIWVESFDLVLVPFILFYQLVAKPLQLSNIRITIAFIVILRVALLLIPVSWRPPGYSWPTVFALLEIATILILIVRLRLIVKRFRDFRQSMSFEEALQHSLSIVLGERFSYFAATEFKLIRYSLFGWSLKADLTNSEISLTSYKKSGQTALIIAILIASVIEVAGMHILISGWSGPIATWISILSLYSMLFLVAEIFAIRKRPTFISAKEIHLRFGIRWYARVPISTISNISGISKKPIKSRSTLNGTILVTPNVLIVFKEPITLNGPYNFKKHVSQVSLYVDNYVTMIDLLNKREYD